MSLYRKYRPKLFADVYGQEHVVGTLEKAAKNNKLVHAYLFAGSRGTGKTSVARILAKVLMTRGIEDEAIKKQVMQSVDDGSIVDLLEIDAASNRGIDDVRDLIEKIQFSPVVASAKVYIIDEVHMLTKEAFNALLKTLEEPPEFAYFILATTELNKIPDTVQSRCQCFPFRHIRDEDIVRRLQFIADQEHIDVERDALRTIAQVSEGGMRDAISLLDQMRSLENITLEDVKQRIGATGREYVGDVFAALEQKDHKAILKSVAKVEEAGVPLDVFTRQLLKFTRDAVHTNIEEGTTPAGLLSMQHLLLQAIRDMRSSPVPGLVLEATLLSLCGEGEHIAATVSVPPPPVAAPKEQAPKKEEVTTETPKPEPTPPPEEPTSEEPPKKQTLVEAPDLTIENIRESWPTVLSETTPASVKMSLKNGRVTSVEDRTIILHFASAFHRDKVRETEASRTIEEVLNTIFKRQLKISCELENGGPPIEEAPARQQEEVVNLADAAAEIF